MVRARTLVHINCSPQAVCLLLHHNRTRQNPAVKLSVRRANIMPQPGKLLTDFNDGPKPPTPEAMSAVSPNLDDNTRLKLVFDSTLKEYGGQGRPHKETSVLMISWHESMDDLNTSEEVDELGEVFEKNFNFKVVKERIKKDHLSPQFHVEKILYDFISEHDSNVSLLIVYYAGHGVQGKNGLDLMG